MTHEIIAFRPAGSPAISDRVSGVDLYGALLADADCESTRLARSRDVAALGRYLGVEPAPRALELLAGGTAGQANAIALGFKADQIRRKLAPNTTNRRLSTMRRACRIARRLGLIEWALDVDLLRSESYRDTAGPGLDGWRAMLAVATAAAAGGPRHAVRNLAIIRCLYDRGLRSIEVLRLDLADVDLDGRRLAVVGKGSQERTWLGINAGTAASLENWIRARGTARGPLMVRADTGAGGRLDRLTHSGLWRAVRGLGEAAGLALPARPHGLRHASTTRLLDLSGGDVRRVRHFTRHKKLETVAIYDDARHDFGGKLSELLDGDVGPERSK